jgi:DNA-binding transcriptional regulator LsrR (DeoR family)
LRPLWSPGKLTSLQEKGAAGDMMIRFFDSEGQPIVSTLNDRAIGMNLSQLKRVRKSIGIGGENAKLLQFEAPYGVN